MDVDIATLLPITREERTFLLANKGCFRCRKVNADHKQADCPAFTETSKKDGKRKEIIAAEVSASDDYSRYFTSNLASPDVKTPRTEGGDVVNAKIIKSSSLTLKPALPRKERETGDWMLNPTISEQIFATWGQPKIDLFARNANKQAAYYYRKKRNTQPGAGCLGEDALDFSWKRDEILYANPAWELIDVAIDKAISDKVKKLIFVALQNNRLKSLSIANPIELKHTPELFIPPSNQGKGNKGVGKPPWKRTFAYLIGGSGADLDLK
jgi:hypothetical protein